MPIESEDAMHIRATDVTAPVHIGREIPLWGLITAFALFCAQAASLYYGQVSQGEKLAALIATNVQINLKLDQMTAQLNQSAFKVQEHSYQILDLQTRLTKLENESQRQPMVHK